MFVVCVAPAQAQRYALLIGNEAYPDNVPSLSEPHQDVERISSALEKVGFASGNITVVRDASQIDMRQALSEFAGKLSAAGEDAVGFFYYSGHGASADVVGQRRNYLIPSDADVTGAEQLPYFGVALDSVIDGLSGTGAEAVFIVTDACRNSLPWNKSVGGGGDKGMSRVENRSDVFLAFAALNGETTQDDGVYSDVLASYLTMPGLTASQVFDNTSKDVRRERGGRNQPYHRDGLEDHFYFMASTEGAVAGSKRLPPRKPKPEPFDISDLPPEIQEVVKQARANKAKAENYAAQADEVKELAEVAAAKAREVSTGKPVNNYAAYRSTGGDYYEGQVEVEWKPNGGWTAKSLGYGVIVRGGTDGRFGNKYYCYWVGNDCQNVAVRSFARNEWNKSNLGQWRGQISESKLFRGFGHMTWLPEEDGSYHEAWYYAGEKEVEPTAGVWKRADGLVYEGEIGTSWQGLGVVWHEDGSLRSLGKWHSGKMTESWKFEWERTGKIDKSNNGVRYRKARVLTDQSEVNSEYKSLCRKKHVLSCFAIGRRYELGTYGSEQDFDEAIKAYTFACDNDDSYACTNLGNMMRDGQGEDPNFERAYALYLKACDLEQYGGCANAGDLIREKDFVPPDNQSAEALYYRGCENSTSDWICDKLVEHYGYR